MRVYVYVRSKGSKRNPYTVMVIFTCEADIIPYRMVKHRGFGDGSYYIASRDQYEEEKEVVSQCNRYIYYRYKSLVALIQDEVRFPDYDKEFVKVLMNEAGIDEIPEEKPEGQMELAL